MKLLKKLAALFIAGAAAITAMAVTASAESALDRAATVIKSGKSISGTLEMGVDGTQIYKITTSAAGTMTIDTTFEGEEMVVSLLDKETEIIKPSSITQSSGSVMISESGYFVGYWGEKSKKFGGTATYDVKKGNYYIMLTRDSDYTGGKGKFTLKVTAPSAQISTFSVSVSKGTKLSLGAVLSAKSGTVSWSSSKSSVVSVDKNGKITAKAKGEAVITAKLGNSKQSIKVIVT